MRKRTRMIAVCRNGRRGKDHSFRLDRILAPHNIGFQSHLYTISSELEVRFQPTSAQGFYESSSAMIRNSRGVLLGLRDLFLYKQISSLWANLG